MSDERAVRYPDNTRTDRKTDAGLVVLGALALSAFAGMGYLYFDSIKN